MVVLIVDKEKEIILTCNHVQDYSQHTVNCQWCSVKMIQEQASVESTLTLVLGLGVCTTCLLLMGLKFRWFRARMKISTGSPQPTLLTGTYRLVESDNSKYADKKPQLHQSMPDLTSGHRPGSTAPQAVNNSFLVSKHALGNGPKSTNTMLGNSMGHNAGNHSKKNGSIVSEVNTPSKEKAQKSSHQVKKILSATPQNNKHPDGAKKTISAMSRDQNVGEKAYKGKPAAPAPPSTMNTTPLMFGDGRVNHKAASLESMYLVPEVGVPFARGSPMPSFALQDEPSPSQLRQKGSPISKSTNDLSVHKSRGNRDSIESHSDSEVQQFKFIVPANKQEPVTTFAQPAFHEYEEYES